MVKNNLEEKNFAPSQGQITGWKTKNLPRKTDTAQNNFDLVLVVSEQDLAVTAKYLDFYIENIRPANIVIITKEPERTGVLFAGKNALILDESSIMEGLTYESVRRQKSVKTGWYFQQFLKMAYARICKNDYYLIFDGDTVPLNPLNFFSDGKGIFIKKGEYYQPYFTMISSLFNGEVNREVDFSFIAESMLINREIMLEIIERIESNINLEGAFFFEKILNAVQGSGLSGREFSEYEMYGNYVMKYHKDSYIPRRIRGFRDAMKFFSSLPEKYVLDYLSRDFDTVSFERKYLLPQPLGLEEYINRCIKG
jgi:hypothetical protein